MMMRIAREFPRGSHDDADDYKQLSSYSLTDLVSPTAGRRLNEQRKQPCLVYAASNSNDGPSLRPIRMTGHDSNVTAHVFAPSVQSATYQALPVEDVEENDLPDPSQGTMDADRHGPNTVDLAKSSGTRHHILLALLLGFTGYYFLRTNLAVALPLILQSIPGVDRADFGVVLSVSYLLYAIGKLVSGPLIDGYGGHVVFVTGAFLSLLANGFFVLIPTGHQPMIAFQSQLLLLGTCWSLNRLVQSVGWGCIVKVVNSLFPSSMHGRMLGICTISYGIGEVVARTLLGLVLMNVTPVVITPDSASHAWKSVFYMSMTVAALLFTPGLFWLSRVSLTDVATKGPMSRASSSIRWTGIRFTIHRLIRKPKFWILLVMAPCLALIRESFISWTTLYFTDALALSPSDAAMLSLVFPLFGTMSTLLGGWIVDMLPPKRRGLLTVLCLTGLTCLLIWASFLTPARAGILDSSTHAPLPLPNRPGPLHVTMAGFLLGSIALCLMAPFSFVDGIFVLSLTGKSSTGVAIGTLSSVGYMGAILAGHGIGSLADHSGWASVLTLLSAST